MFPNGILPFVERLRKPSLAFVPNDLWPIEEFHRFFSNASQFEREVVRVASPTTRSGAPDARRCSAWWGGNYAATGAEGSLPDKQGRAVWSEATEFEDVADRLQMQNAHPWRKSPFFFNRLSRWADKPEFFKMYAFIMSCSCFPSCPSWLEKPL